MRQKGPNPEALSYHQGASQGVAYVVEGSGLLSKDSGGGQPEEGKPRRTGEDHEGVSVRWELVVIMGGRETKGEAKLRVREGKGGVREKGK